VLEREANVFAAELLMPEEPMRAAWAASEDPSAVAEHFGVSPLAAQWRLFGFGLTGAPAVVSP
jgi:Zn-dependent peptidase ImmA (M78 family)